MNNPSKSPSSPGINPKTLESVNPRERRLGKFRANVMFGSLGFRQTCTV